MEPKVHLVFKKQFLKIATLFKYSSTVPALRKNGEVRQIFKQTLTNISRGLQINVIAKYAHQCHTKNESTLVLTFPSSMFLLKLFPTT